MRLFLDTANLAEIEKNIEMIDGVTTNPTLVARESADMEKHLREILKLAGSRPVMAEVTAEQVPGMIEEGRRLAALGPEILVKIPATLKGLGAIRALSALGIRVTATLAFNPMQVLLAAKAGAFAAAVFAGRLDDAGGDGVETVRLSVNILKQYGYKTQVVAASVRGTSHVTGCALAGADIVTAPANVLEKLMEHPLTTAGLEKFLSDWRGACNRKAEKLHA
jgi:transaldolase